MGFEHALYEVRCRKFLVAGELTIFYSCQWDVIGGSPNGIDAGSYIVPLTLFVVNFTSGVGAYGLYRNSSGSFCSPGTNQSWG